MCLLLFTIVSFLSAKNCNASCDAKMRILSSYPTPLSYTKKESPFVVVQYACYRSGMSFLRAGVGACFCLDENSGHFCEVSLASLKSVGVIIMDLSKAFDSLNHELLVTKLKAYGLDSNSVTFMKNFLTNRL